MSKPDDKTEFVWNEDTKLCEYAGGLDAMAIHALTPDHDLGDPEEAVELGMGHVAMALDADEEAAASFLLEVG